MLIAMPKSFVVNRWLPKGYKIEKQNGRKQKITTVKTIVNTTPFVGEELFPPY